MFCRLNRKLRKMIAAAGAVFLLMSLVARMGEEEDNNDGFQTKEFDDIW